MSTLLMRNRRSDEKEREIASLPSKTSETTAGHSQTIGQRSLTIYDLRVSLSMLEVTHA